MLLKAKHIIYPKRTRLDYILFDKHVRKEFKTCKILEEGSISITSDHLPVIVFNDFVIQRHNLVMSKPKLPTRHKTTSGSTVAYRNLTERSISELLKNEPKDSKGIDKFVHDL